jgi:filamentous hemagglutinin
LTAYALDSENPKGKAKAMMFRQCLGFSPANYQSLLAQIEAKALDAEAILGKQDEHG